MKKAFTLILTSLIIINLGVSRVFADTDTFTDFTDVDPDQLINITSSYSIYDLWYTLHKNVVIDSAVSYAYQMNFDVQGNHTIAFTGSYYDNSIVSMEGCSSSSYTYNTQSHTIDGIVTVEPAVYGSLSHNSQNMFLNFGISVESTASAGETIATNTFQNSTQACSLLGMNTGDGAIDGTTLLQAGYTQKTITYNDGSLNGHTATFYVPGNEDISFSTDLLDDLINAIYVEVLNSLRIDYHYEYDLWLNTRNKPMPEYGYIYATTWLPLMLDSRILNYYNGFNDYMLSVQDLDHTSANYNNSFYSNAVNGSYNQNYTSLYWSGTDSPHWTFSSNRFRDEFYMSQSGSLVFNDVISGSSDKWLNAQLSSNPLSYTVDSSIISAQPSYNLVSGYTIPIGFRGLTFAVYKLQDTSRLNLFNQLGSFLQNQFNRLVNSIGNISGDGSGSDIAQDIQNEYNIDIDTDINNNISNLIDRDQDIDLTLPEFNLPSSESLQLISDIPQQTINIFTRNNLGYMIFLPFIVAIVGKVLK